MSNLVKRAAARIPAKSVTDKIERALFAQAEINYMSGATALMQQEIALTQMSLYHKPAYNRNWAWDYRAEARINGHARPERQYAWDDKPELRRDAEDDEPVVRRDVGSKAIFVEIHESPKPAPNLVQIAHNKRNLIDGK